MTSHAHGPKTTTAGEPFRFTRRVHLGNSYGSGRCRRLGWDADDLHATTTRHVHGPDDLLELHRRITLHEEDLVRARIVDPLELPGQVLLRNHRLVDHELRTRQHLEHDLVGWLLLVLVFWRLGIGELQVDRDPRHRDRDHEDDQQHQEHVDHRNDV